MEQQTARPESHALQRYRVLDFDDQFGFLHAELCHGRERIVQSLFKLKTGVNFNFTTDDTGKVLV